jgi:hypothetical protein
MDTHTNRVLTLARNLASSCITQHVDFDVLERMRVVEQAELETLQRMATAYGGDE